MTSTTETLTTTTIDYQDGHRALTLTTAARDLQLSEETVVTAGVAHFSIASAQLSAIAQGILDHDDALHPHASAWLLTTLEREEERDAELAHARAEATTLRAEVEALREQAPTIGETVPDAQAVAERIAHELDGDLVGGDPTAGDDAAERTTLHDPRMFQALPAGRLVGPSGQHNTEAGTMAGGSPLQIISPAGRAHVTDGTACWCGEETVGVSAEPETTADGTLPYWRRSEGEPTAEEAGR